MQGEGEYMCVWGMKRIVYIKAWLVETSVASGCNSRPPNEYEALVFKQTK